MMKHDVQTCKQAEVDSHITSMLIWTPAVRSSMQNACNWRANLLRHEWTVEADTIDTCSQSSEVAETALAIADASSAAAAAVVTVFS